MVQASQVVPLESPLGPEAPQSERVQVEWRSFFSGPVWPEVQEWLQEVRQAAHESVVNAKSWDHFKEERGRFLLAEQLFNFFEDRYEACTGSQLPS